MVLCFDIGGTSIKYGAAHDPGGEIVFSSRWETPTDAKTLGGAGVERKLLDLIGRIMSTVGTITDAAALYIGPEGDINGIIVGTEGKAKIQTIGAGGYNIQCFHFRTLIHEIK